MSDQQGQGQDRDPRQDQQKKPERAPINETDSFGEEHDVEPGEEGRKQGQPKDAKDAARTRAKDIASEMSLPKSAGARNVIIIAFAAVGLIAVLLLLSMCVNNVRVAVPSAGKSDLPVMPPADFSVDNSGDTDRSTSQGSAPSGQ